MSLVCQLDLTCPLNCFPFTRLVAAATIRGVFGGRSFPQPLQCALLGRTITWKSCFDVYSSKGRLFIIIYDVNDYIGDCIEISVYNPYT
jgi:hypothetical protein